MHLFILLTLMYLYTFLFRYFLLFLYKLLWMIQFMAVVQLVKHRWILHRPDCVPLHQLVRLSSPLLQTLLLANCPISTSIYDKKNQRDTWQFRLKLFCKLPPPYFCATIH